MVNSDILRSINKGVPCSLPISLNIAELKNLSTEPERVENRINKSFAKYVDELVRITRMPIILDLSMSLNIFIDSETLEKSLNFSLETIYSTFAIYTDAVGEENLYDIKDLVERIDERINILKTVCNEKTLKRKFPQLAKLRESNLLYYKEFELVRKKFPNDIVFAKFIEKRTGGRFMYESYIALKNSQSVDKFVKYIVNLYESMISNMSLISDYLKKNPINLGNLYIDDNKLDLYIANRYLYFAENSPKEMQQEYLYYVSNYLFCNPINKEISIIVSGKIVNRENIYERYKNLMVENPELRSVDFKLDDFKEMNLEQVGKFMSSYFEDLKANWDFLAMSDKSPDTDYVKDVDDYVKRKKISLDEKEALKQRMIDLYMKKKEFFDLSNPVYRIKGRNTFNGYIGYIYQNGKVVLEKFFNNSENSVVTYSNAIYVMNIGEFVKLSQLSKSQIIAEKLCKRFIHKGDWQSRVLEEINCTGTQSVSAEMQRLLLNGLVTF